MKVKVSYVVDIDDVTTNDEVKSEISKIIIHGYRKESVVFYYEAIEK